VESTSIGRQRHQAPGGWRRAVVGILLGAGLAAALTRLLAADPPRR
jgi:hypothetical protein